MKAKVLSDWHVRLYTLFLLLYKLAAINLPIFMKIIPNKVFAIYLQCALVAIYPLFN